ncbi:metalloregulator ArsR/SmtB family transcription factor [Pseudonocardia sp. ICBG601]|uniref:ArsR/SmtB family transcription factor n=1 Tax=Pseudonocardia sp. ICBG601 TaxID=2846759 RepID=UPI001CF67778|nr:metalloregulator ArsR/SmtB family transcription factor [Pseudonocardia sp. ICBG601]
MSLDDRRTEPLYRIKAELFKCLAHPVRIRILEELAAAEGDAVAVSELITVTGCEASQLSQHLAVLRRAGLATSTRSGNAVDYRLAAPLVAELLVVARAFLLAGLARDETQLAAARALPPLPGASARVLLEAGDAPAGADAGTAALR